MYKIVEKGDIFNSKCDFLVNPVNTVGVMGKGLALEFKNKYPNNFEKYKKFCKTGEFTIGKLLIILEKNKHIVNFPTKLNWRNKSKLEYVIEGLEKLKIAIKKYKIKSIAIPKLACGLGGLDWSIVFKEITKFCNEIDDNILVEIYI